MNKQLVTFVDISGKLPVRDDLVLPQQEDSDLPRGVLHHHQEAHQEV